MANPNLTVKRFLRRFPRPPPEHSEERKAEIAEFGDRAKTCADNFGRGQFWTEDECREHLKTGMIPARFHPDV